MKSHKLDVFLISLGLATLVVQRFFLPPVKKEAEKGQTVQLIASAPAKPKSAPVRPQVVREPEWPLTFPANSKYQELAPPRGVRPNPFREVQRIAQANGQVSDYAGKDTDMRLLLAAHAGKDYLFVLQQQAANEMLRREIFPHYYADPTHPRMLEALAFYTEQLLEARSEDAKLMYMCLRALKDHWPSSKVAQVALATARRVEARQMRFAQDTTTVTGHYRQVYARELKKMGNRLKNRS
ncbi:hypothetical protein ACD591_05970 [Rufibacter glacialis]|uniref:Uncharacterized protein n=1 Tax=Rufibacter glacialis TaxID=1259555 RepID=A0A5M8QB71_9BACT|nr:hypothetical protein [Rufibacter glacialis]KAA6433209.1 hypothetical protein FOE74_12025 [Rufibacter glacialis]GGK76468.1 hypothetical protein GCM10011405_25350 [Rufibacter glacialis]